MPKREIIMLEGQGTRPGSNVSQTVGTGGRNDTGDVLLIQAMFRYIAKGRGPEALGFSDVNSKKGAAASVV
jgi:hypothetical protein